MIQLKDLSFNPGFYSSTWRCSRRALREAAVGATWRRNDAAAPAAAGPSAWHRACTSCGAKAGDAVSAAVRKSALRICKGPGR